jgi:hypothetical protein
MSKYIKVNAGTSDMGTINSSERIAATLYSLGTLFISGIYVQIHYINDIVMMMMIIIIIITTTTIIIIIQSNSILVD